MSKKITITTSILIALLFLLHSSETASFTLASLTIRSVISLLRPMGMTSSTTARTLASNNSKYPIFGDDSLMKQKSHGSCTRPVMKELRWNLDYATADNICCFNRHYAEYSGYWTTTNFLQQEDGKKEITFYDSVSGVPLFIAPRGRSFQAFVDESKAHGWPSFRDDEVVWENVRSLSDGEMVSLEGSHLGHNLPDHHGNRYCINLVSVAGTPPPAITTANNNSAEQKDL